MLCGRIVIVCGICIFPARFLLLNTGSIRFYVDPKAVTKGSKYCYTVLA